MLKPIFTATFVWSFLLLSLQAEVFHWKQNNAVTGNYADSINWNVGAIGAGNPQNLVPGAEDVVFCSTDATWNLGGNEYTIKEWQDSFDDWTRATITLENGVLNVMSRSSRNDTINLINGASLVFPKGSCYLPFNRVRGTRKGNSE